MLAAPSTGVKIIKPDGCEADVDESGEVLAHGPQVVMGYLDNETATQETFDEAGWLHTRIKASCMRRA
jgi:4-coumarate--CoA ligase